MVKKPLFVAILYVLTAQFAHTGTKVDLMAMSLEELLQIKVVSQRPESVRAAPGIVTTYQADELRSLGLKNLKDFLDFAPGVQVNPSASGTSVVSIRGLSDSHGQKVLLLVDGVPSWSPTHADIPLLGIPLSAIDRIEVMRGPSAVIYGTNASAGVINIVTREKARRVEIGLGELGYRNGSMVADAEWGNNARLTFALEYQDEDGFDSDIQNAFNAFDMDCLCFPSNADGSLTFFESKLAAHSKFEWQGFNAALLWYDTTVSGSSDGSLLAPYERMEKGQQFSLSYQRNTEKGYWKIFSDRDHAYVTLDIPNINAALGLPGDGEVRFDNNGNDNIRWRTGAQYHFSVTDSLSVLTGVEYEHRSTENNRYINYEGLGALAGLGFELQPDGSILLIEAASCSERSIYTELDAQVGNFDLRAGVRNVENCDYGEKTLPRVSAVYNFLSSHSFKMVYAEGFNSPTFRQMSATDSFGQPIRSDLDAELITSFDVAYNYTASNVHFVLNAFYLTLDDAIVQQSGRFVNAGSLERKGLEIDYRFQAAQFSVFANASHFIDLGREVSELDEGDEMDSLAPFTPLWEMDLGANYRFGYHRVGASMRARSNRKNASSHRWLNVNYEVTRGQWLGYLNIENVLGDDLVYPDVRSGNDILRQGADKQRVVIGAKYNF